MRSSALSNEADGSFRRLGARSPSSPLRVDEEEEEELEASAAAVVRFAGFLGVGW